MTVYKKNKKGMTLVELIITSVITVILIGAACSVLYFGYNNYTSGTTDLANHQNASLLEDYLQHDLATATAVTITTNQAQSAVMSGVGAQDAKDRIITMHFDSNSVLIIEEKDSTTTTRITGIKSITFNTVEIVTGTSSAPSTSSTSSTSSTQNTATRKKLTYIIQASDTKQNRSFVLNGGVVLNNCADCSINRTIKNTNTTDYFNIQMPKPTSSSTASTS